MIESIRFTVVLVMLTIINWEIGRIYDKVDEIWTMLKKGDKDGRENKSC